MCYRRVEKVVSVWCILSSHYMLLMEDDPLNFLSAHTHIVTPFPHLMIQPLFHTKIDLVWYHNLKIVGSVRSLNWGIKYKLPTHLSSKNYRQESFIFSMEESPVGCVSYLLSKNSTCIVFALERWDCDSLAIGNNITVSKAQIKQHCSPEYFRIA